MKIIEYLATRLPLRQLKIYTVVPKEIGRKFGNTFGANGSFGSAFSTQKKGNQL